MKNILIIGSPSLFFAEVMNHQVANITNRKKPQDETHTLITLVSAIN